MKGAVDVVVTPAPEPAPGLSDVAAAATEPVVPTVSIPVHAHSLALSILAMIAGVVALEWAQAFVISLLLGILISYTLNPPVAWLERIRIPRVVASLIVMLTVIGALGLGAYSLRGQMQTIVEQLPVAASKFSAGLARLRSSQQGAMQKMQSAAIEVEKATAPAAAPVAPRQAPTHVVIDQPRFKVGDFLWVSSKGAFGALGQAIMVLFLTFFLLLGGDTFKRKLVRLTGPSLSKKKITVQILDDINESIQKYLFMLLVTNVLVGLLAWGAFS
jgi:predicted PurR-regulated permease PerM